ncbi:hypothetical protein [Halobacillus litoralis]|uniref:Uncharacterized protein n=1 Tax=Halobacillus litoralis TaxID=45668 RepID=A0A410MJ87_9BACI|nr:hypothetical protein [Halobacillus litoralis]QAS54797.1 hypothetical protein HLI_21315 [Halobacillus litoralis]
MKNFDEQKSLINLIVASLMGEGEPPLAMGGAITSIQVPFAKEKSFYLLNYLQSNNLKNHVTVQPRKNQFVIHLNGELTDLVEGWYKGSIKVFTQGVNSKHLTRKAIMVYISLFGNRQIEGVSISTNIQEEYLNTLAYCIEKKLKINVVPSGSNKIKIPEVTNLFLTALRKENTYDCTEIACFLTNNEKSKLVQIISSKGCEQID